MGGGWRDGPKWVMRIKNCTCDKHWAFYISDESLNSTLETNTTLYVK